MKSIQDAIYIYRYSCKTLERRVCALHGLLSTKPPLDPAVRDAKRLTFEAKLKAIGMQSRVPGQQQVIILVTDTHAIAPIT